MSQARYQVSPIHCNQKHVIENIVIYVILVQLCILLPLVDK